MEYIFMGVLSVAVAGMVWTSLKIRQLNKFSDFLHDAIDDLYENDRYLTLDLDIEASYAAYHRAMPWRRDFANMVVYHGR